MKKIFSRLGLDSLSHTTIISVLNYLFLKIKYQSGKLPEKNLLKKYNEPSS
jgi:hypothetical protein